MSAACNRPALKPILAISILVAAAFSLLATEQDDPRFAQWMENSRAAFAHNHMIAYVRLESLEGKPHSDECRYDRYPGKVERIQLPSGVSYARKKGKKWSESDDWGESGKPVTKKQVTQLNDWVAWVDVALSKEKPEVRDKSQGAIVVRSDWLTRPRPRTAMRNLFSNKAAKTRPA